MRFLALAATAACLGACLAAAPAAAVTITDPVGDFAPGYTGGAADLDVTSFTVRYDAVARTFFLGATMAGAIDPTTIGTYIIGVDTGTGTIAPFAGLGAPNVRFNQTVRVNKDGSALVGSTPLTATISGNSFGITVAESLFPSTGFTAERYGWNLWPRTGVGAGTLVTDFSPDNAMLAAVPEPASWALMIGGVGVVGGAMRRRRRPAAALRTG